MGISPTSIKVTALGGLLALGTGLGIASANAETTPSPSSSTSVSSGSQAANSGTGSSATPGNAQGDRGPGGPDGKGKGKGMRGVDAATLASKLGLDEAKVTAALTKVHDALRPAAPTTSGSGSTQSAPTPPTAAEIAARDKAFATALAKELGVTEAKVTAALTEIRAAHQAEHKAELSTRLDAAVKAGTLTAADKTAVLKAFDAGVLGGPGGPRG